MPYGQYYQEMYLETQSKVYGEAFFAKIVRLWAIMFEALGSGQ